MREQFLIEVTDTTSEDLTTAGVDHATALLELNRLFVAWAAADRLSNACRVGGGIFQFSRLVTCVCRVVRWVRVLHMSPMLGRRTSCHSDADPVSLQAGRQSTPKGLRSGDVV